MLSDNEITALWLTHKGRVTQFTRAIEQRASSEGRAVQEAVAETLRMATAQSKLQRELVIEECAKVCRDMAQKWARENESLAVYGAAFDCADAIHALRQPEGS